MTFACRIRIIPVEREGKIMPFSKRVYPFYDVLGRTFQNYKDALNFAQDRSNLSGEAIDIMEKLDEWTAWYSLQIVKPQNCNN